jgi:hypothetical protein
MSTAIEKREQVSPEVKQEILRAISKGYVNTAEDIAEIFPVSEQEAIELLNDDEFYLQIANGTRAKMRMLFNTKGVDVLEKLLDSSESKDNIAAYDRLAKATGGIQEEKQGVNNFNFFNIEDLLEAKEKREKVINIPKTEFNRVKNSKNKKQTNFPNEEVNGNIFENEEESDIEIGMENLVLEEMFEESEELDFD